MSFNEFDLFPGHLIMRTPDHPDGIKARVHEIYRGLDGQTRVALVDSQGRVWHYDQVAVVAAEATP